MEPGKLTRISDKTHMERMHELFMQLLEGTVTKDGWTELGGLLSKVNTATEFMLGAWINQANPEWGDALEMAEAITRQPKGKLKQLSATVEQLEFLSPDLTFVHHQILTELPPAEQEEWANKAMTENLAYGELRRAVREHIGKVPESEETTAPKVFFNPEQWARDFVRWTNHEDFAKWPKPNLKKLIDALKPADEVIHRLQEYAKS